MLRGRRVFIIGILQKPVMFYLHKRLKDTFSTQSKPFLLTL